MTEQRRSRRFEIRLPLKIVRSGALPLLGSGETRNLCSRGVLFISDVQVDVGESVEYLIALPPASQARWQVSLRCLGKVIRFEQALSNGKDPDRPFCLVASIDRYEFVRPEV